MGASTEIRGWNKWTERAWAPDVEHIRRWFEVQVCFRDDSKTVILMQLILGWDDSAVPDWVAEAATERIDIAVRELPHVGLPELVGEPMRGLVESSAIEVRRLSPPTSDWNDGVDSRSFNLALPVVVYEVWAPSAGYDLARAAWDSLTDAERHTAKIVSRALGYLGSAVVLVPQRRHFLHGVDNLVLVGVSEGGPLPDLKAFAEVLDGDVPISQVASTLRFEPRRDLTPDEEAQFLSVYFSNDSFAEMNAAVVAKQRALIARHPVTRHGLSGSDWRLTVLSRDSGCSATVGLIRGLGGGYFTKEPWRGRDPTLGFSGPARVVCVPNSLSARGNALDEVRRVGAPAFLCDPYAEPVDLADVLRGGKIITSSKALARIDRAWALSHGIAVSTLDSVHDRFLVGPKAAYLIGASLNRIGTKYSFLVALDNTMRLKVATTFDELWRMAKAAW